MDPTSPGVPVAEDFPRELRYRHKTGGIGFCAPAINMSRISLVNSNATEPDDPRLWIWKSAGHGRSLS